MAGPRLVLVGGGHAHLEILRRSILRPRGTPAPFELTLIAPGRYHHYSGMVPGFVQGTYREEDIRFDLQRLVERAGGRFVSAEAVAMHAPPPPEPGAVELAGGESVPFDLVSWNIGSRAAGGDELERNPRVALIKPIFSAVALKARLDALAAAAGPASVAVVGGGAAGVEIACAAATVLDRNGRQQQREVKILEAGPEILRGYGHRFRARAASVLASRDIEVMVAARVVAVDQGGARLDDGGSVPADFVIWLTGAVAAPILARSGLPCDERGFLLVDPGLRSIGNPRVFAAGDCATLAGHPDTAKAGVYAVRQAPVLWRSLLASVRGGATPHYSPQSGFLSLLNTGDGRALLSWRGLVAHSRWAFRLKDRIDRRFLRRYSRLV